MRSYQGGRQAKPRLVFLGLGRALSVHMRGRADAGELGHGRSWRSRRCAGISCTPALVGRFRAAWRSAWPVSAASRSGPRLQPRFRLVQRARRRSVQAVGHAGIQRPLRDLGLAHHP